MWGAAAGQPLTLGRYPSGPSGRRLVTAGRISGAGRLPVAGSRGCPAGARGPRGRNPKGPRATACHATPEGTGRRHEGTTMQTEAAILWEMGGDWEIETIELDPPEGRRGAGAGSPRPACATATSTCGPATSAASTRSSEATRVPAWSRRWARAWRTSAPVTMSSSGSSRPVATARPAPGATPTCATSGALLMMGAQIDGTYRHHSSNGTDLDTMVCLGTFAKHTVVNQASCVKILDHYPLDKACLIGCGVTTGWGSAVYAAEVKPGRRRGGHRHRWHRGLGHPGGQAGRGRAHLRHRPGAVQAGDGQEVRRHPHRLQRRGGDCRWSTR